MEQNINVLAYQLSSRDSMMYSKPNINIMEIVLSEEDEQNFDIPFGVYFTKQVNSKNSLNEQEINGSVSK